LTNVTLASRLLRTSIISRRTRQMQTVAFTSLADDKMRLNVCPFRQLSK